MRANREEILELQRRGVRPAEIARVLGLAPTTVDYHLAAARSVPDPPPPDPDDPEEPCSALLTPTRDRVLELLETGLSRAEVARLLGVTKSTVSYHAHTLGKPMDGRCARRYDWVAIQSYYDLGHSVRDCQRRFGFSIASWNDAVKRGAVIARPAAMPLEQLLQRGVPRNRNHVKQRLLAAGLKNQKCESCGIAEWRGRPLALALHHVNGDRHDNRLENLRLLCPNCHSQTDNFAGRNGRRLRKSGGSGERAAIAGARVWAEAPRRGGRHPGRRGFRLARRLGAV